jgi:hypothetical protein
MFYLFKAAFWLGLVFLLMPDNSPPSATSRPAMPSAESLASAAVESAAALCRTHAETCTRAAGAIGEAAQRELVRAVTAPTQTTHPGETRPAEPVDARRGTLTPADLAVPFGGVAAPAGNAPRRAPLPPRRPA